MAQVTAIVLAAGKGTRMKSNLPKVLHQVCGLPMVQHVLNAVKKAGITHPIVVIGHGAQQVQEALGDQAKYAVQEEQLGTGHAVQQAKELLHGQDGHVVILCGDTPLVTQATLEQLIRDHIENASVATVLTAVLEDPTGYGRIVRNASGTVERIVEHKDATEEERGIGEINTGVYCFQTSALFTALEQITPANAQGEYYLTDVLEILNKQGKMVQATVLKDPNELMGINDRRQLAIAEGLMRQAINQQLMLNGVTIMDPQSTFVDAGVSIGADSIILPFTMIEGESRIGENCVIGPGSRLKNAIVADGVEVNNSIILQSQIGAGSTIGPYAYIRPDCQIGDGVKIGDFVEIKKSSIGTGSKVPHLSYVGDSLVGQKVNIGAGTITCNYDGEKKSTTIINNHAFIGSNSNLVAPVEIGEGAFTAAGSTVTKNVPDGALAVSRSKQVNLENWTRRKKS